MSRRCATRLALAALAVLLLLPAASSAATRSVSVGNNVFSPRAVTVDRGDRVTWNWRSSGRTHNVTGAAFADSGNRSRGSFSVKFSRAGRFAYRCTLHSGMTGTVVVRR